MRFYNLKVKNIKVETSDTKSFYLELPNELKDSFFYKAGQYLTIKVNIEGKEYRRAYSIPSSPYEQNIGITVKRIDEGIVSNYLNNHLKNDDFLEVAPPLGNFIYEYPSIELNGRYILVAAGSGITPIMSILKEVLNAKKDSQVVLIYGNKTEDTVIYLEELNHLKTVFQDRLQIHQVYSQVDLLNTSNTGRIDVSRLENILSTTLTNTCKGYVCGPEGLINTVINFWSKNGGSTKNLFFEKFTSSNIEPVTIDNSNPKCDVEIVLDDEQFNLSLASGQTILNAMLEKGIDAPYSCEIGNCSSCIARVLEGICGMYKCETLDEDEVEEGYILACQAYSKTKKLVISFD
jgi:ring-1,2-phenylacetyl-CoA epoxidase subunit PaaE